MAEAQGRMRAARRCVLAKEYCSCAEVRRSRAKRRCIGAIGSAMTRSLRNSSFCWRSIRTTGLTASVYLKRGKVWHGILA